MQSKNKKTSVNSLSLGFFSQLRGINRKSGFTLVELIIVITILAILSSIAFISFKDYFADARDANRTTTMTNIVKGLEMYKMKTRKYPMPENSITITASGEELNYQGYFGESAAKDIDMQKVPLDPSDEERYIYSITKNKKSYQLLAYMENEENQVAYQNIITKTYADYTDRYPKTFGKTVGIVLTESNAPITGTGLDISTGSTNYKIIFGENNELTASGYALSSAVYAWQGIGAEDCPEGFISVPGNVEFGTTGGFCVAQYEMGYSDGLTPDTCDGTCPAANNIANQTDWNTVTYVPGKKIVSESGVYPIAKITQQQAIDACKSMGNGYHLITNNEWMTIARNIETVAKNWSSKEVGVGNLYNGVSNDTTFGCTGTGGNTESRNYATKTGPGTDTACNAKRKHTLSNGQEIWDLAGNVSEHVNKANTIDGVGYADGVFKFDETGANWNGTYEWHKTGWNASSIPESIKRGYGPSRSLSGTGQGMGNIHGWYTNNTGNVFLRGGGARASTNGGVLALNLYRTSTEQLGNVGFRCVR